MGIPPITTQLHMFNTGVAREVRDALGAYTRLIGELRAAYPSYEHWSVSSPAQAAAFRERALVIMRSLVRCIDGTNGSLRFFESDEPRGNSWPNPAGWSNDRGRDAALELGQALLFQLCLIATHDAPGHGQGLQQAGVDVVTLTRSFPQAPAWLASFPAPPD